VLDAILLEQEHVPGIPVITAPFRETGNAMAASWGLTTLPVAEMPHPIASLGDAELDLRTDALAEAVLAALTDARRPEG
jgi:hypothetical protein